MVNQQQIRAGSNREFDGCRRRIDGCGDACDLAPVLNLEPVYGAFQSLKSWIFRRRSQ